MKIWKLNEGLFHGVHDSDGCTSIEVLLSNTTNYPITITAGVLNIIDDQGIKLSHLPVFGIDFFHTEFCNSALKDS